MHRLAEACISVKVFDENREAPNPLPGPFYSVWYDPKRRITWGFQRLGAKIEAEIVAAIGSPESEVWKSMSLGEREILKTWDAARQEWMRKRLTGERDSEMDRLYNNRAVPFQSSNDPNPYYGRPR